MRKSLRDSLIYRNLKFTIRYLSCKNNKVKKKEKINIVFLVSKANVWNSVKSVYDAACKEENIKVHLVALPPLKNGELDLESDINFDFCKKIDENTIKAYDKNQKTYFDIRMLNPDYIIYFTPYSIEYPKEYSFEKMAKVCKLCYISYGYSLVKSRMQQITIRPEIMSYVSYIFPCNDIIYKSYKKNMFLSELICGKRLYNIGFPRFDLYRDTGANSKKKPEKILWLPRWTTDYEVKKSGNEPSSFFLLKDCILDYARKNSETEIVIRPHPLAFENYIKHNMMTAEEVALYKERIEELKNTEIDTAPDYYEKLVNADVLIADFTSIVAEYFVTGRPIIYFGSGENFPREHKEMYDSFYHAKTWEDAEKILAELKEGNDRKEEQRKKAVENFTKKMPQNVGAHIVKILTEDNKSLGKGGK